MQEVAIFILGLAAGFLGATVGGGGMIYVPGLMLLGFPPQAAVSYKPSWRHRCIYFCCRRILEI